MHNSYSCRFARNFTRNFNHLDLTISGRTVVSGRILFSSSKLYKGKRRKQTKENASKIVGIKTSSKLLLLITTIIRFFYFLKHAPIKRHTLHITTMKNCILAGFVSLMPSNTLKNIPLKNAMTMH